MHEEIACSGGYDHPIASMDYWYNQDQIDNLIKTIGLDDLKNGAITHKLEKDFDVLNYKRTLGHGLMGAGNLILAHRNDIEQSAIPSRVNNVMMMDDFFSEIKLVKDSAKFYGNVHGFTARAFDDVQASKEFLKNNEVVVVDLVRHPITRFESQINNCTSGYGVYSDAIKDQMDKIIDDNLSLVSSIEKRYKVDFSEVRNKSIFANLYFFNAQNLWAHDISNSNFCRIYMERLKYDQDYFAWLVHHVTKGQIVADNSYLKKVYSSENINCGRNPSTPKRDLSARQQWEEWPDWLRDGMRKQVADLDLKNLYNKLDYDLSFI